MHYIYVWHANYIYLSKFQVNAVTSIEVIVQNVFSYARVMVIGVGNNLKYISFLLDFFIYSTCNASWSFFVIFVYY